MGSFESIPTIMTESKRKELYTEYENMKKQMTVQTILLTEANQRIKKMSEVINYLENEIDKKSDLIKSYKDSYEEWHSRFEKQTHFYEKQLNEVKGVAQDWYIECENQKEDIERYKTEDKVSQLEITVLKDLLSKQSKKQSEQTSDPSPPAYGSWE